VSSWSGFVAHDDELAIDLPDESLDNFHPEPFAILRPKFRWQPRTIVRDRYNVTMKRWRFKSNDDFAFAMFR
jgi:hypothetical protein